MAELRTPKTITPKDESKYQKQLKTWNTLITRFLGGIYKIQYEMAATRKLQAEIDRCLKRVSEGVELFEEVWNKVHYATNSNQKDKYESDLKKEIKKLQRLRDQIKVWIASAEIKDKSLLIETRKLIETQMERFKVVERETKTKAYSKEGLGLATKSDPITRERDELNAWLITTLDSIQMQIDSFECDIDSVSVCKKKKMDKEKQEKVDMYRRFIDKHKFHIGKLELILRTLDNITNEEKLPVFLSQVKKIKEDVDYYLESGQDPEYEENEYLYDDIEFLDDILGSGIGHFSPSLQTLDRPQDLQQYEGSMSERRKSYSEEAKIVKPLPVKPSTSSGSVGGFSGKVSRKNNKKKRNRRNSGQDQKFVELIPEKESPPLAPQVTPVNVPPPSDSLPESAHSSNGLSHHQTAQGQGSSEQSENCSAIDRECSFDLTSLVLHPKVVHSSESVLRNEQVLQNETSLRNERVPDVSYAHAMQLKNLKELEALRVAGQALEEERQRQEEAAVVQQQQQQQQQQQLQQQPQQQSVNHTSHLTSAQEQLIMEQYIGGGGDAPDTHLTTLKSMAQEVMTRAGLNFSADQRPSSDATTSAHIPPLLGVAPLGPMPLHPKHDYQLSMLEAAHYHLPCLADSEPLRQYLARNPIPTPNYYPQSPLVHSDSLEFFGRMSIETLFFIFYYLEGTRAQYMAAKVLKKQSWRFHTKFMMWFQRHEEPKVINEVYEQGTYIYFDIEKWGQRKKDGFVFEYQYLEDRDLN